MEVRTLEHCPIKLNSNRQKGNATHLSAPGDPKCFLFFRSRHFKSGELAEQPEGPSQRVKENGQPTVPSISFLIFDPVQERGCPQRSLKPNYVAFYFCSLCLCGVGVC